MKLLFCRECRDVINLLSEVKSCSCGKTSGKYLEDNEHAEYSGEFAVPFAIDNFSFFARMNKEADSVENKLYDDWHGKQKIQCWILKGENPNAETIKKVEKQEVIEPRKIGKC